LLSLGGGAGTYGFASDAQAQNFADLLWGMFGSGNYPMRPFDNATVDGFDLDIESGSTGSYTAFVQRMRENYASDPRRQYFISAAPQCPQQPEQYLNNVLAKSVDFSFVQFYNNPSCNSYNS